MRTLGRILGRVAAITAVFAVVLAGMIGLGGGVLIVAPIALLSLGVVMLLRRTRTMEVGWAGSGTKAAPVSAFEVAPSTRVVDKPATSRFGVAGSLARVEARELLASPWFHVGLALWIVIILMFGLFFLDDIDRSWREFFALSALMCHPLAAFTIVAAHRNRSRSRRDGCDEMFDACPADANARTLGHLGTAWIPAAAQVVLVLTLAVLVARNEHSYGSWGTYVVAALLVCAVLGAGAVGLGVTLGRWAPWDLVPFVAVAMVGIVSGNLNTIGQPAFATDRLLATLVATTDVDTIFIPLLWWERLAWLAGISTVVATLGLLGGRSTRVVATVLAAPVVAAIVAALLIVRPASSDGERIAELVADPLEHSACFPVGSDVHVCAYEGYEGLATDAATALEPVVASIPDGVLHGVVLLTYFERDIGSLTAEAQSALHGRTAHVPEGALRLRYHAHPENFEAVRLRLASHAVGLPTETVDQYPTMVDGQARGVIVLWLAGQGLDESGRHSLITAESEGESPDATDRGSVWPARCQGESAVLQWSQTDLNAARVLFALSADQVGQVIIQNWAALTAPDATTDELLQAVGAAPLGPPEPIEPRMGTCS
jgi:hypothetical protein